ncbi:MAG: 4Fe-4S dicluster domain-containing protein, partial [Bacteroidota bacterium]
NRRDFLKLMGFGMTAATLAACAEGPVKKAIPYVNKPDDIIPGVANYYASTTPAGSPTLVRTREGRPIKTEGNPDSPLTRGGLSSLDQASVLDMYDDSRFRAPMKGQNYVPSFGSIDDDIKSELEKIKANGGKVRILSHSVLSPSTRQLIGEFLGQFEDAEHITYDPLSTTGLAAAHEEAFGKYAVPSFDFGKAKTVVSFDADFLGTWIAPEIFATHYMDLRDPEKDMSRHLQFESLMTMTGSKADLRFPMNPSQQGIALLNLYNKVASRLLQGQIPGVPEYSVYMDGLSIAAKDLVDKRGESLLVSGSNDKNVQLLVIAINQMLGNYGSTIDIDHPAYFRQGDDRKLSSLVRELEGGEVDALLVYGANPVYDSPFGATIASALPEVGLSISFADRPDETAELCKYVAPDHYYLESWGDAQQTETHFSLLQPTIYPIFKTRQVQDSLLTWMGRAESYLDYLKAFWEENLYPLQSAYSSFRIFWNEHLRKGVMTVPKQEAVAEYTLEPASLMAAVNRIKSDSRAMVPEDELEIVYFERCAIMEGKQANNPWLQELPDPISRVCWDNYVSVPVTLAQEMGLKNEDVIDITVDGETYSMPVYVQPGQARQTIAVALGFGRKFGKVVKRANGTQRGSRQIAGTNFFPAVKMKGSLQYHAQDVKVEGTGLTYPLALVQTFNLLFDPATTQLVVGAGDYDRSHAIIEETTLANYRNGKYKKKVEARQAKKDHLVTLWDSHYEDPETAQNIHWKMAIDLNKCTGCGACVVACQAENNIPVVGKTEVRKRREMAWLRIDRYYSGDPNNPDVVFQPMMCQHCDNAPCETVCPVLATIHSNEGLNQMTYNRCVGTRYCANNCPYKVRRFNWFNYWQDEKKFSDFYTHSKLGKLVLNPDVTVRFRGVMEKCSFCVQRLQEAKLRAKIEANSSFAKPKDGSSHIACQQSCSTGAIVFGDFNDPNSAVSKAFRKDRSYAVLEEIKALPSVQYQALVRNRTEEETELKHMEHEDAKDKNWWLPGRAPAEGETHSQAQHATNEHA